MAFGAIGAFVALRKKSQPTAGEDQPQWFYVRDLVHEVRELRMMTEGTHTIVRDVLQMLKNTQDRQDRKDDRAEDRIDRQEALDRQGRYDDRSERNTR